ncbi:hypothetical protein J1N35_034023 [Gossypium stocksii]|uniref:Uncharacterized protein n=1 Tax=Gossypium stocksii TaxID=47602 RepID=A0A9D3ZPU6_9ROSI|nr:hypothetical protein J1N35_034023 [Gossypium stocksii]
MLQRLLNEQPIYETLLAHIFQIRHPIQIPKLVPRMVELDPRLCKSAAPNQTTTKFLQAKSTVSAMLAQAKTKKEYKKLMAEMLSSMVFESEDEKSSASSIKMVNLAD